MCIDHSEGVHHLLSRSKARGAQCWNVLIINLCLDFCLFFEAALINKSPQLTGEFQQSPAHLVLFSPAPNITQVKSAADVSSWRVKSLRRRQKLSKRQRVNIGLQTLNVAVLDVFVGTCLQRCLLQDLCKVIHHIGTACSAVNIVLMPWLTELIWN